MSNKFEIGQYVVHTGVPGKKFKIFGNKYPDIYDIIDSDTGLIYTEPIDCLLDLIESRDNLIDFIINNK